MTKHTILFLAANPVGTDRLALDREARAIQVELERSGHRDQFELVTRWAAEPLDLLRELRKLKPTVVHFSGHGTSDSAGALRDGEGSHSDVVVENQAPELVEHGLYFQCPDGRPQLVSAEAIAQVFGAAGSSVKLVTLSACYSDAQAEALLAYVGCVVGMRGSIRDDAARSFATGFYGGLGERESVGAAYRQGCAAIGLEGLPDGGKPLLRFRESIDAELVFMAGGDPGTPSPDFAQRPTRAFSNPEVEALSKRLEDARTRRRTLRDVGIATNAIDQEHSAIIRQQGEGIQLRPGAALGAGRYVLVKTLGRGGFAVVWEAHDRMADRRVAIKVLHSHLACDVQRRERFYRGARVMMALTHPAVVRIHDPRGEDDALCYFVMELVPGGTLREAVIGKRIESSRLLLLVLQVGDALAEAHRRHLIHRDVKPENILLDEHGNAKLTDFDLVGAHDTTGGTRTGALGTFFYAAPECLDNPREATARADVFGLGMTMIFCLLGQALSMSTFRHPEMTVGQLRCSKAVRKVLACTVAWEPERRFADAGIMLDEFRRALNATDNEDDRAYVPARGEFTLWTESSKLAETVSTNGGEQPHDSRDALDVAMPARVREFVDSDQHQRVGAPHRLRTRLGSAFAIVAVVIVLIIVGRYYVDRYYVERDLISNNLGTVELALTPFDLRDGAPVSVGIDNTPDLDVTVYGARHDDGNEPGDLIPGTLVHIVAPLGTDTPQIRRISAPGGALFLRLDHRGRPGERCGPSWIRVQAFPGFRVDNVKRVELPVPTCQATVANTVTIDAGPFWYGGPGDLPAKHYGEPEYTEPERLLELKAFAMDRTEVSNAAYAPFGGLEKLTGYFKPVYSSGHYNHVHDGDPNYPVSDLDAYAATAFCRYMGKRLPGDLEWAKAARGGLTVYGKPNPFPRRLYPWGRERRPECVNFDAATTFGKVWTQPVDALSCGASPYGVLQLVGNVQEWVLREGQTDLDNPLHVLRGGSTEDAPESEKATTVFRNHRDPRIFNHSNGVRCVLDLENAR